MQENKEECVEAESMVVFIGGTPRGFFDFSFLEILSGRHRELIASRVERRDGRGGARVDAGSGWW